MITNTSWLSIWNRLSKYILQISRNVKQVLKIFLQLETRLKQLNRQNSECSRRTNQIERQAQNAILERSDIQMLLHDKERQITILEEKVRRLRGSDGQDEIPVSPVIYCFLPKLADSLDVTFSISTFKFTISLFLYFDKIWSNHQYIQCINRFSFVFCLVCLLLISKL